MDRTLVLLCAVVSAPFLGLFFYNGMSDPVAEQRAWIEDQLASIVTGGKDGGEASSLPAWHEAMVTRPSAWESITTPPPPPKPPAPEAPKPPDVKKMLEGLRPSKSQIGDKIKMATPQNERGEWFVVGDVYNGCELTAIEKTAVVFTYNWREGNKQIEVRLPRGATDAPRGGGGQDAPPPPPEPEGRKKPAPKRGEKAAPKAEASAEAPGTEAEGGAPAGDAPKGRQAAPKRGEKPAQKVEEAPVAEGGVAEEEKAPWAEGEVVPVDVPVPEEVSPTGPPKPRRGARRSAAEGN